MEMERKHEAPVRGPRFFHHVYSDTRLAWLWLPLRLYAGYAWITASLPKVTNPQWFQTGEALKDFWQGVDWDRSLVLYLFGDTVVPGPAL